MVTERERGREREGKEEEEWRQGDRKAREGERERLVTGTRAQEQNHFI